MDHPSLEEAISRHLIDGSQKWEQFFQGKLFLVRMGGGFSEYGFVYEGKIWYGEEKEGSDVYYSEGTVENILPVFINQELLILKLERSPFTLLSMRENNRVSWKCLSWENIWPG